jgi:hypothetical protein
MNYLYYTLWQLLKKIKTNDTPATNAMLLISLCQILNLLAVYFFISLITNVGIVDFPKATGYLYSASIGSIFFLINYFILYKKREVLDNKFKNETKKQRNTGRILLGLYFGGSFFIAIYFGVKVSL